MTRARVRVRVPMSGKTVAGPSVNLVCMSTVAHDIYGSDHFREHPPGKGAGVTIGRSSVFPCVCMHVRVQGGTKGERVGPKPTDLYTGSFAGLMSGYTSVLDCCIVGF